MGAVPPLVVVTRRAGFCARLLIKAAEVVADGDT